MGAENWAIQYGSFGLLAALVFWTVRWGIPKVLDVHEKTVTGIASNHEKTVTKLVDSFKAETEQCRGERIELAKSHQQERAKDQQIREESIHLIQSVADALARVECLNGRPTQTVKA